MKHDLHFNFNPFLAITWEYGGGGGFRACSKMSTWFEHKRYSSIHNGAWDTSSRRTLMWQWAHFFMHNDCCFEAVKGLEKVQGKAKEKGREKVGLSHSFWWRRDLQHDWLVHSSGWSMTCITGLPGDICITNVPSSTCHLISQDRVDLLTSSRSRGNDFTAVLTSQEGRKVVSCAQAATIGERLAALVAGIVVITTK